MPQDPAQRFALEQLGHDVGSAVVDADVVDGEEVGVVESRGGPGLALEALPPIGAVDATCGGQHLDRHLAAELGVPGPPHLAHPTGAEGAEDFVAVETITRREGHDAM